VEPSPLPSPRGRKRSANSQATKLEVTWQLTQIRNIDYDRKERAVADLSETRVARLDLSDLPKIITIPISHSHSCVPVPELHHVDSHGIPMEKPKIPNSHSRWTPLDQTDPNTSSNRTIIVSRHFNTPRSSKRRCFDRWKVQCYRVLTPAHKSPSTSTYACKPTLRARKRDGPPALFIGLHTHAVVAPATFASQHTYRHGRIGLPSVRSSQNRWAATSERVASRRRENYHLT